MWTMKFCSPLLVASMSTLLLTACGDDKGDDTGAESTSTAPMTDPDTTNGTTTTGPDTDPATDPGTASGPNTEPTTGPSSDPTMTTDTSTSTDPTTGPETTTTTGDETTTGDTTTTGNEGLSWEVDVWPVLNPPVACDCHTPGSGGLKMPNIADAYTNLVGVKASQSQLSRVEPGSAQDSYFWHKINGTQADGGGGGSTMPLGAMMLPQSTIDLVAQWIDEGAAP